MCTRKCACTCTCISWCQAILRYTNTCVYVYEGACTNTYGIRRPIVMTHQMSTKIMNRRHVGQIMLRRESICQGEDKLSKSRKMSINILRTRHIRIENGEVFSQKNKLFFLSSLYSKLWLWIYESHTRPLCIYPNENIVPKTVLLSNRVFRAQFYL